MPQLICIFLGLSSLFTWFQMSDHLCLARAVVIYNDSIVVCLALAIPLLLYGFLNHLTGKRLSLKTTLASCVIASIAGAAAVWFGETPSALILFCIHVACLVPLLVEWGAALMAVRARITMLLALLACVLASLVSSVALLCFPAEAPGFLTCMPALSGACWYALCVTRPSAFSSDLEPSQDRPEKVSSNGTANDARSRCERDACATTTKLITRSFFSSIPWTLMATLCAITFLSSFFQGLITNPFLSNSTTMTLNAFLLTALLAFLTAASSELAFWLQGRKSDNKTTYLSGLRGAFAAELEEDEEEDFCAAEDHRGFQPAMHWCVGVALMMLVCGLTLFAMSRPETLLFSLSMTAAGRNCFVVLCIILFSQGLAQCDRRLFVPCVSLLFFAMGLVFAPYLGAWANKVVRLDYSTSTGIATVLLGMVSLLCAAYMVTRMRKAEQPVVVEAPPAAEEITYEEAQAAVRAHHQQLLEPYGLTEREMQIISMMLDGQTMGGIADQLFITLRTVKFHSRNAYEKLGVSGKKQLLIMFSDPALRDEPAHLKERA